MPDTAPFGFVSSFSRVREAGNQRTSVSPSHASLIRRVQWIIRLQYTVCLPIHCESCHKGRIWCKNFLGPYFLWGTPPRKRGAPGGWGGWVRVTPCPAARGIEAQPRRRGGVSFLVCTSVENTSADRCIPCGTRVRGFSDVRCTTSVPHHTSSSASRAAIRARS